jgi:signal transduction histidine kinase
VRFSLLVLLAVMSLARGAEPARPVFTPEETQWVAQHPTVRLGVDPAWPPFSFIGKDGRHQGIDAEILALVGQRVGLQFELVPAASWAETQAKVLGRLVEIVPGAAETEERKPFVNFTQPYLSPPVAVIMREDAPFWVGLRSLEGRRIAAARGYVTTAYLQREYPELPLVLVDSVGEALELVARRGADAVLANLVSASHAIRVQGLTNLKIVGLTELHFDLRLAVQKDEPELLAILDKGLATMTERERHAIVERWIRVNLGDAINWQLIRRIALWVLLPGAGVLLGSLFWNQRLARELAERRKVEAALRLREAELKSANADLQKLNDDRRSLMNMLAHDLYSPLSAVTLGCDYLRGQVPAQATALQHDLGEIQAAGERMAALVRNLLSADAIEQGQRRFVIENVAIGAVVAGVVEGLQRPALGKRIALTASDATGGRGRARCDLGALEQIVENLVSNALKFTPLDGRVTAAIEARGSTMRLMVEDSGPGIPVAERARLFGKFARLTPRPTGGETSNGMGLAIVRLLVRAMQGDVEYQDAPSGGARFVVTLPAGE